MSAIFSGGPETIPAAEPVQKNRLVELCADGIKHATAEGSVMGAVLTDAKPKAGAFAENTLVHTPHIAAVYTAPHTVNIECDDAASVKRGAVIYAAADGKVAVSGTNVVGVAVMDGGGSYVPVRLMTPVVAG